MFYTWHNPQCEQLLYKLWNVLFCTQNRSIVLTNVLPLRRFLAKIMERYFCNNKQNSLKNCLLFLKADEVETKADNMAEAIAQQNKKVEEESKAMEKAIDEKGKQVDTKEQEDKFEKASEKVDAMGNAADKKFEQKGNVLVSK